MQTTMASEYLTSSQHYPPMDEQRWVIHIREAIEEDIKEDVHIPVSVFSVPKPLLSSKPEAYIPQLFAVGPYHHWHPQLYEMERYKLATAKRTQRELRNISLQQLVDNFRDDEHKIRSHYHRYLDFSGETLAWMMAIDASFLLEFLRNYSGTVPEEKTYRKVPSMAHMVDSKRIKLAYNLILKDVVMLENQIPLFLLRKIMHFQCSSAEEADTELLKMLMGFVKEVSPFTVPEDQSSLIDVSRQTHLLGLLYSIVVPSTNEVGVLQTLEIIKETDQNNDHAGGQDVGDYGGVKKQFDSVWGTLSKTQGGQLIKKVLIEKPMKFLIKVIPWSAISKLPLVSVLKGPIQSLLFVKGGEKEKDDSSSPADKPPLVEEISIPSVTELVRSGVKFSPTNGGITMIKFDVKTATFFLPVVTLDCNTEVLLRNLVAYESIAESGPMVFTRYTELINGIIDTDEDVRLLRESNVIKNRMKSDREVADVWNEMRKSVRITKVPFIDKALVDVNKYYQVRMSVKMRKVMHTYVLGSWRMLTFLAAILLLLLTCVESFCSVYSCRAHWLNFMESNGN